LEHGDTLAALILAGGQSRRMGRDKALLDVRGTTLLRRTWDVATSVTPTVCVITPHPERYRPQLPPTTQWIVEPMPPSAPPGPLVALAQAWPQVETDWVLLLACDLPALRSEVLQIWARSLPTIPASAIAYLPRSIQGWEPLCGFYHRRCLSALQAYVAKGGRSFQSWLAQQSVQPIPTVPPDMLMNCNTPQDWHQYQQRSSS